MSKGWALPESSKTYNLEEIKNNDTFIEKFKNKTFYKERWIKENDIEQRIIITYSVKYQEYQKRIREKQIEKALKIIDSTPNILVKQKQNDPKRFITKIETTEHGEIATEKHYNINQQLIDEESKYDGLYAVCTNLEDDVSDIIKINQRRWEIEESFRIMKTEFKARPVYLSRDDRIKAHFTTCFLALVIFRYLEKITEEKHTVSQLIETLRNMEFLKESDEGFIPIYTRTTITDDLHEKFGFRTDYEIMNTKNLNKIFNKIKN